tara:strand:+ start:1663 stop:2061 length:399 start_codon:yes stop_codon:yes gene_type:complete
MSLYVRVIDGEVIQVWDTPPPERETGWRAAVEVRPEITAGRESYDGHTFDLTSDPVEIVYGVRDLTVDDHKGSSINKIKYEYERVADEQTQLELYGDGMDMDILIAAKTAKDAKLVDINACTTHDDIDALAE